MGAILPPGGRIGRKRAPMAEINVTPFVDVMLVLLIIFMVTAPLLVTGVPIRLPESRARALDQDRRPTVISIDALGDVMIDDEPVDMAELPDALLVVKARVAADEQIFLRADSDLSYGTIMRVMGELNRIGLNRVALLTTSSAARSAAPARAPADRSGGEE